MTIDESIQQTIKEMADDIRAMDQLIYQMSQCTSWSAMRPYFLELCKMAGYRQRAESNRINEIMRRELLSVYTRSKEEKTHEEPIHQQVDHLYPRRPNLQPRLAPPKVDSQS